MKRQTCVSATPSAIIHYEDVKLSHHICANRTPRGVRTRMRADTDPPPPTIPEPRPRPRDARLSSDHPGQVMALTSSHEQAHLECLKRMSVAREYLPLRNHVSYVRVRWAPTTWTIKDIYYCDRIEIQTKLLPVATSVFTHA